MTSTLPLERAPRGARLAVWLIHAYQVARAGHISPCRFTPTCSEYAVQAVTAHGTRRGLVLTGRRLLRCRPGGPFGYDPVPPAGAHAHLSPHPSAENPSASE